MCVEGEDTMIDSSPGPGVEAGFPRRKEVRYQRKSRGWETRTAGQIAIAVYDTGLPNSSKIVHWVYG